MTKSSCYTLRDSPSELFLKINMGEVKRTQSGSFIEWHYKKMHILGVLGSSNNPLNEWENKCSGLELEFAPVKAERERDFLPFFSIRYLLDITATKAHGADNSIVMYGTSRNNALSLMHEIMKRTSFVRVLPTNSFINPLHWEVENVNVPTYALCERIASSTKRPIEKVFAQVHYANYLISYRSIPQETAMRIADQKFR